MARRPERLVAAAWGITVPMAGLAAARLIGYDRQVFFSMGNAGTPFVYLPAYGVAAVGLARRRPALTAVAAGLVAAHLAWTAPELHRRRPIPPGVDRATRLRLATSNIRFAATDSSALGTELAAADPDVLLLQELSPEHLRILKATGLFDCYPYSYVDARHGSFGAGIWSRYSLSGGETWYPGGLPTVRATVTVDGTVDGTVGESDVAIFNVHCKAPMRRRWIPIWKDQLRDIRAAVKASPKPVIVAGDFNSTFGHAPFRGLLRGLLRDAHVLAGRGLATTWPRGGRVFPPLFRLDHVLVSDGVIALAVSEGHGSGSDHRPVIADLVLPGRLV